MSKQILVNASPYETRVATLENGEIRALHIEREEDRNVVGNIYKGVVKRVLPGMQAAFLELGLERTAFLYVDDIIDEPFGSDVELIEDNGEDDTPYEGDLEPEGAQAETQDANPSAQQGRAASQLEETREIPREPVPPAAKGAVPDPGEGPEAASLEDDEDGTILEEEAEDWRAEREREGEAAWLESEDDRNQDEISQGEGLEARAESRPESYADEPNGPKGHSDERQSERDFDQDPERESGRDYDRPASRSARRDREGRGGRGPGRGRRPPDRRARRQRAHRRPRGSVNIQDLIKEGQELLVQVAKAPIGTKGARLTTHISLPGRNLVLMPTVKHLGISRRIQSDRERRRLREIFTRKLRTRDMGFIIRTVAEGKSFRDLKADADYLMDLWEKIKRDSQKKRAPALIHEDVSLGMRAVRDFFTDEVDSFIIDTQTEYDNVQGFVQEFMPRLKSRVKYFKGPSQIFEHYGIEAEISRALGKKIWLKSGGYLLIDQSEALTAIDVNTGRYVGSKSLEETIFRTNIEAVKEVAYQLRIRNVGGIIIIDLIDMESASNREKVYQALQEALGEDRAKTNILKISELGLVEMTRKRTHEDLVRYLTEACTYCDGRGYHKSSRTVAFEVFREIEKEALSSTTHKTIVVFANPNVASKILKEEKAHVTYLEERFSRKILVKTDPLFHVEQFEVFGKN